MRSFHPSARWAEPMPLICLAVSVMLWIGCNEPESDAPLASSSSEAQPPSTPAPTSDADPFTTPTADADTDASSDPVEPTLPSEGCQELPESPTAPPLRLMTRLEYNNTIYELFGDDSKPANDFPPETTSLGFGNGEAHGPNPLLVESYMSAAEEISSRAVEENLTSLIDCDLEVSGAETCGDTLIEEWGSRIFRRPLDPEEFLLFKDLYLSAVADWGFETALSMVLQSLLQSPQFLYRIELGTTPAGRESSVLLSGYEVAARLAYLLWNSPPDDELLQHAESGTILDVDVLEAQARRMLADKRAASAIRDFHEQWMDLENFQSIAKDAATYPNFKDSLREDWREELLHFVEYVFLESEHPLDDFFLSPVSFLNSGLAEAYEVVGEFTPGDYLAVSLDDSHRSGILTQPGLLALLSGSAQSSPILRGIFVREKLLCQPLPPPPNDVSIVAPDPDPTLTTRERFAAHTEDPACQGCHILIDPIGFGFEAYDGMGAWRTQENGLPIDTSGELLYTGFGESEVEGPFQDLASLSQRLRNSEQVQTCMATQWFRYSLGHLEAPGDACSLQRITDRFIETQGDLKELLVALIRTDTFRYRSAPSLGGTP